MNFGVWLAGALGTGSATADVQVPPASHAKLTDYFAQPTNKVFVIAIDPGGDFSWGYGYGKSTVKEAATVAVEQCDAARAEQGILTKARLYAINNRVVYADSIRQPGKGPAQPDSELARGEALFLPSL